MCHDKSSVSIWGVKTGHSEADVTSLPKPTAEQNKTNQLHGLDSDSGVHFTVSRIGPDVSLLDESHAANSLNRNA